MLTATPSRLLLTLGLRPPSCRRRQRRDVTSWDWSTPGGRASPRESGHRRSLVNISLCLRKSQFQHLNRASSHGPDTDRKGLSDLQLLHPWGPTHGHVAGARHAEEAPVHAGSEEERFDHRNHRDWDSLPLRGRPPSLRPAQWALGGRCCEGLGQGGGSWGGQTAGRGHCQVRRERTPGLLSILILI